ncbi:hypothetical protein H0S68_25585 (plasmid) [Serratia sp. AXJ-M]|uniref:hypothetical protein n=1 Tax=Serratia sp. AXJ-M TaxID=2754727 RepID=UPI00397E2E78
MTMADFRRMAAKMDQHMQKLDEQGVTEPHQVINHMMDLHNERKPDIATKLDRNPLR